MPVLSTSLDQIGVSTLRFLSVDMIEKANSGHPGLPLGAAPMAYCLFSRIMKFDPTNPDWQNRDRFILSAGHGSALLYSLLYEFGYEISLDDLKNFRQLGSKTPGHPEVGHTPGVECTTGPLGQGLGNGVGMALAETWLANKYNTPTHGVVNHYTYVLASDGDLMEGVAQEAASLAGHLGLGKLVVLYDSNDISLDGPCENAYTESARAKFEAMGWHTSLVEDGNDLDALERAIKDAQQVFDMPSLIEVKTVIGYGSPKAGSSKSHGAPLGEEAVLETKKALDYPIEPLFYVSDEVQDIQAKAKEKGAQFRSEWEDVFAGMDSRVQEELWQIWKGEYPDLFNQLGNVEVPEKAATRDAGSLALNALAKTHPALLVGGADLASSTKTVVNTDGIFSATDRSSRNIWYGVREHAMGAIMNGLALHNIQPIGSTFLVFSDYMRGSIRLACLSGLKSLFVFTHDSVFVGEDGPTHQPIEHIESLRAIPKNRVFRPADTFETIECWKLHFELDGPSTIVETRQGMSTLSDFKSVIKEGVSKGGYVLFEPESAPQVTLIATGSEVSLALDSVKALSENGISARVVSIPCREIFLSQSADYQNNVLGDMPRVSIEAGVTSGWKGIVGSQGIAMGIDDFGFSGPGQEVYDHVGMTVENVVSAVNQLV